jgi:hypothetical protein
MANDEPTSLRMGFGFPQARAAGAPFVPSRPGWRMNWDVKCRECEKKLRDLVVQYPSVGVLIKKIVEAQKANGRQVWAVEIYHLVLYKRPHLAPSGYWQYAKRTYGWDGPPQSK